jgi:hypothetical protein
MPDKPPITSGVVRRHRVVRYVWAPVVLLMIALASGLGACGSSTDPKAPPTVRHPSHLTRNQRAELVELVRCSRRHGVPLPKPNSEGQVIISRAYLKSPQRKAIITNCIHEAAREAKRKEAG